MTTIRKSLAAFSVLTMMLAGFQSKAYGDQAKAFDWRSDWALADGLNMKIDATGFSFPSHIVFVPNPGSDPKDPLYFVVELKGNIKVVTNDRTVHTFAENFLPNSHGESFAPAGAAGICLDSETGYVFATFAYLDDTLIYRNGMVRFTTTPGRFGLKGEQRTLFLDLFRNELSAASHQIGPCSIKNGLLYVTVGYGEDHPQSQNLHTTLGSVIRMTRDFRPVPENPFFTDDGKDTAKDYIWAYGFRNPFGLKFVGNRLFATENGGGIDRFNEIEEGENYLSDGADWSIGARAAQVFSPAIGIVDLEFVPRNSPLFPDDYRGRFVAAAAGPPGSKGPGRRGNRSVIIWEYDLDKRRMASVPRQILRFRGQGVQIPVSMALGPDALYFTALIPNQSGVTPIYKITHDPAANYPHRLAADRSPQTLISQYGCRQCHKIGRTGGTAGPPLDSKLISHLTKLLNAPEYKTRVDEINKLNAKPYVNFLKERENVLAAHGEERVRRWLPVYLRQPKFDNPKVEMPALGLSERDSKAIAEYLIETTTTPAEQYGPVDRLRFAVSRLIPELRYRHMVLSFLLGAVAAAVFLIVLFGFARRRARKR